MMTNNVQSLTLLSEFEVFAANRPEIRPFCVAKAQQIYRKVVTEMTKWKDKPSHYVMSLRREITSREFMGWVYSLPVCHNGKYG